MFDVIQDLDINYYEDYAEPGCSLDGKLGIFAANWNPPTMGKIGDILEKLGYALEWGDEWAHCYECYKAVRVPENSYWWRLFYKFVGRELFCIDCMKGLV